MQNKIDTSINKSNSRRQEFFNEIFNDINK